MSADDYRARIKARRIVSSSIIAVVWIIYVLVGGDNLWDVTIFLGILFAFAAWPRNTPRTVARWQKRIDDFNEAVDQERDSLDR
jgi:hypothetical protein